MPKDNPGKSALLPVVVALGGWLVPGGGHYLIDRKRHAAIIFLTITLTFGIGLYVGSVGVIDPVAAKPWYVAQIMNSPAVVLLGRISASGGYPVFGKPQELGQIYTAVTGLLNLLCIVNATYLAYVGRNRSR